MMKVVFILVLVPMYDVSEYDVSTYQCTVLLYHPFIYQCTGVYMYVSMYWRVYVCMYRLKYMYQCIRTNPILIGKEGKNKMYLES
jgi:hypothetical protein